MIAGSRTEGEHFPTQAREAHRPGVLPGGTVDGPCRGGCGRALGRGFSARPGRRPSAWKGRPTAPPRLARPGACATAWPLRGPRPTPDPPPAPRRPGLLGVEPARRAWVAGPGGPGRRGEPWCAVRKAWPNVERVGSDAGTGLARGVKRRHAARAPTSTALEPPTRAPVPSGFEVLHTARERPRGVRRRWAGAATRFETAAKADEQVAQAPRHGIAARAAAGRAPPAWQQAARAAGPARRAR